MLKKPLAKTELERKRQTLLWTDGWMAVVVVASCYLIIIFVQTSIYLFARMTSLKATGHTYINIGGTPRMRTLEKHNHPFVFIVSTKAQWDKAMDQWVGAYTAFNRQMKDMT